MYFSSERMVTILSVFTRKMEKQEKLDFQLLYEFIPDEEMKKRIRATGNWYIEKAIRCKVLFYFLSILGIFLPLVATGANAFGNAGSELVRISTILCSLITSLSASLLAFTRCGDKWKIYRKTIENIKRELSSYWIQKNNDEALKNMMDSIEKCMEEENRIWVEIQRTKKEDCKKELVDDGK